MIHVIVLILLQLADAGMRRGLDRPPLINGRRGWPGGLDRFASQYTAHQRAATAAAHVQLRGQMRQDVGMVSPPDWLDRYRAGQRDPVWHELRQLGGAVREPGLREEAQLVCDEMARRARQNVEVIIERLSSAGTAFTPTTVGRVGIG
jgi:hypothetical protein